MSPDVLLECPRTSFMDVLRVNVTERVWHSPPHVCKSLCLIVLVPISVLCCILMLVPAFVCFCESVSLCLCCCLSCVFTSFLEKKNRRVSLCACIAAIKVITCIAAVQISLFADCCQQPMSPSRPTYISKQLIGQRVYQIRADRCTTLTTLVHLISLTPVMRTM